MPVSPSVRMDELWWIFLRLGVLRKSFGKKSSSFVTIWPEQRHFTWRSVHIYGNIMVISRSVLLRTRNVLDKSFRANQNTHWHSITLCPPHIFFFFYCRYNPLWVLAFSVILFHSALSSHCFLHRLTPIICKSSSMPAVHLFRGLPLVLVPIGFHCNILLGVLLSFIHITWPSQAILLLFL